MGDQAPQWPLESTQAAFRIVEALEPGQVICSTNELTLGGASAITAYVEALANAGNLTLQAGTGANTIRIKHAHSGSNR